jgi:hypothetical protein
MPSRRKIGELLNAWIKSNYRAQGDNLRILFSGVAPTQELPTAVFIIVRYMQDRRAIVDYLSQGDNGNVFGFLEPPTIFHNNLLTQRSAVRDDGHSGAGMTDA